VESTTTRENLTLGIPLYMSYILTMPAQW